MWPAPAPASRRLRAPIAPPPGPGSSEPAPLRPGTEREVDTALKDSDQLEPEPDLRLPGRPLRMPPRPPAVGGACRGLGDCGGRRRGGGIAAALVRPEVSWPGPGVRVVRDPSMPGLCFAAVAWPQRRAEPGVVPSVRVRVCWRAPRRRAGVQLRCRIVTVLKMEP